MKRGIDLALIGFIIVISIMCLLVGLGAYYLHE